MPIVCEWCDIMSPWQRVPAKPSPDAAMRQSLTLLSRLPVAKKQPSGAQLTLQMMRLCALSTLPTSLNGGSPEQQQHLSCVLRLFIVMTQT